MTPAFMMGQIVGFVIIVAVVVYGLYRLVKRLRKPKDT